MKLQLLLIVFFVPFFGYSQCPSSIGPNLNGNRFILTYDNTTERDAADTDIASIIVDPGSGPVTYTVTPHTGILLRTAGVSNNFFDGVDVGSFSFTINLSAGGTLSCDYEDGILQIPMPVSLISFTAKERNQNIVLEWSTASELNNQHFEIERSNDDGMFKTIGIVNGKGDSFETIDYSYIDSETNNDQYYYRLKQVDFDGTTAHSDVINIEMKGDSGIEIFPTLIKKGEPLNIKTSDEFTYQVYSSSLQLVKFDFQNESSFNTAQLNEGIYFVQFSNGITKRFIVIE